MNEARLGEPRSPKVRKAVLKILKRILELEGSDLELSALKRFQQAYPDKEPTPKRLALLISSEIRRRYRLNPRDVEAFASTIAGWISTADPDEYWRALLSKGEQREVKEDET